MLVGKPEPKAGGPNPAPTCFNWSLYPPSRLSSSSPRQRPRYVLAPSCVCPGNRSVCKDLIYTNGIVTSRSVAGFNFLLSPV